MALKKKVQPSFLFSLSLKLYEYDLCWSSVLISEYLYRITQNIEVMVLLLKGLLRLDCATRIVKLIEDNGHLIENPQIKIVYYKAKHNLGDKEKPKMVDTTISKLLTSSKIDNDCEFKFKNNENYSNNNDNSIIIDENEFDYKIEIDEKSIEQFYEAITKSDVIRAKQLKEAFNLDNNNLESLFYLYKDGLIPKRELIEMVSQSNERIRAICSEIFFFEEKNPKNLFMVNRPCFYDMPFYNPIYIFTSSKDLFRKKKKTLLFNLSFAALKLYPNSIYTYLSLGLYFLMLEDYKEAKKCLMRGARYEKNGFLFLYLGICYSALRECENAVSCFNISHKLLIGSWKPIYYLACEHQRMTNYDRATFYFKEGLNIERNAKLQEKYVSLLVFCEYYDEALSYLASQNNPQHYLLRVYCFLFKGKITESINYLNKCDKDWKFYATFGYIEHLINNLDNAANMYSKSLLIKNEIIVEELMTLAIENLASKSENDVYKYCTELFENLFTKTMEYDVV